MPLTTKSIKGSGLTQLRSMVSSSDGTTVTKVETWTGPYSQLLAKQTALLLQVKGTSLQPTEANHGILTITREVDLSTTGDATLPNQVITEVVWQELKLALEQAPFFADLPTEDMILIRKAVEAGEALPTEGELQAKYYEKLTRGAGYSTGVPVVRRTTTKRTGKEAKGNAWFRDAPPVTVDGDWDFLKTADETRRDGKSYTRVEEWTGGKDLDTDLYP